MFKKLMYDKIVEQLNANTQSIIFQGGYLLAMYKGMPVVIDTSSNNAFDYALKETIPVSEEYFTETPSVDLADRSDYNAMYNIIFRVSRETEVMTAMDEFRTYFFNNKMFELNDYQVAIKTNRGDKQPAILGEGGNYYIVYSIKVALTAVKNGQIWDDSADKWEARIHDTGAYETLKLDTDVFATNANPNLSNSSGIGKSTINLTNCVGKLRIYYNGTVLEKAIYRWIMNKLDKKTLFDFKHTHDGETFEYLAHISGGTRTRKTNGVKLLEFDFIEADV